MSDFKDFSSSKVHPGVVSYQISATLLSIAAARASPVHKVVEGERRC